MSLGRGWGRPAYGPGGVWPTGGVSLTQAFGRHVGTCRPEPQGAIHVGGPPQGERTAAGPRGGGIRRRATGPDRGRERRGARGGRSPGGDLPGEEPAGHGTPGSYGHTRGLGGVSAGESPPGSGGRAGCAPYPRQALEVAGPASGHAVPGARGGAAFSPGCLGVPAGEVRARGHRAGARGTGAMPGCARATSTASLTPSTPRSCGGW